MLSSLFVLALAAVGPCAAHNLVYCTNNKINMTALLNAEPFENGDNHCDGYPRGMAPIGSDAAKEIEGQGWPWQFIWPNQDGAALTNHRAVNWLQEDPVYDPTRPPTTVKPGSTILVQLYSESHERDGVHRPPGHHKIFLAGPSGTQIKTADQLTFDRVVFHAPASKYAHVIEQDEGAAGLFDNDASKPSYDTGCVFLPLKLVDPAGNYLPDGVYNFVWTWYWPGAGPDFIARFMPSYSTSFDVIIDSSSPDSGLLTDCVENNPNCANDLVGTSNAAGALDKTSPWPPYAGNYLYTNYEGDDPSTETGKREWKPDLTEHVPASPAPAIVTKTIPAVRSLGDDAFLTSPIPLVGGGTLETDYSKLGSMKANMVKVGLPITKATNIHAVKDDDPVIYHAYKPGMAIQSGNSTGSMDFKPVMSAKFAKTSNSTAATAPATANKMAVKADATGTSEGDDTCEY